MINYPV